MSISDPESDEMEEKMEETSGDCSELIGKNSI
jgi:hypothetical protein